MASGKRPNKGRPYPNMGAAKRLSKLVTQGKRDEQCARVGCYREGEYEQWGYCSPECYEQDYGEREGN